MNYIVIVSPPFFPTASSTSATVRNLVALSANATESDVTKVTVFDPENRLVAFSGTFKQGVREIISQWGQIFVLTSDGKVCCCFTGINFNNSHLFLLVVNVSRRKVNSG